MEITRKVTIPGSSSIAICPPVLIVDINNADLLIEVDNISKLNVSTEKRQNLINNLIQSQLEGIIMEINQNIKIPSNLSIDLNMFKLHFSLDYWEEMVIYTLQLLDGRHTISGKVYVTEQSCVDRQSYVENNPTIKKFHTELTYENRTPIDDEKNEFLNKLILLYIFKCYGIDDDGIESILERYSSIDEILEILNI